MERTNRWIGCVPQFLLLLQLCRWYRIHPVSSDFSEVGSPEAIYEEPRFSSGPGRPGRPPSVRPPPVPQTSIHTGTLETVLSHADGSGDEICSTLDAKARAAARASSLATQRTGSTATLVCGEEVQRETEYSVPFAGPAGRTPRATKANLRLNRSPVDGRTLPQSSPAVSLVSDGTYALPYDPKSADMSDAECPAEQRRSVPDVAAVTVRQCEESAG